MTVAVIESGGTGATFAQAQEPAASAPTPAAEIAVPVLCHVLDLYGFEEVIDFPKFC